MKSAIDKLIQLARKAYKPVPRETPQSSPLGFSTRVAARWAESRRATTADLWQQLCWWGATASVLVCLSTAAYRVTVPEPNAYDLLLAEPTLLADDF